MNLPIQPLGAAPGSRYRTATAAGSCTLFSACLVPLGSQAALPTSQAYSSGETKVIINAGDSADDHDTDGKPVPGTSSASSTGSRSYVFTSDALTGYNGNASASATDPYGTLKGIVRGSGSGRANCSSVLRRPVAIRPVLIASVSSHLEKLP